MQDQSASVARLVESVRQHPDDDDLAQRALVELRCRLANHSRHHPEDTATIDTIRRELRTLRVDATIRKQVRTEPALTRDQISWLARRLRGAER
jgi:hypothetical protein